MAGIRCAVHHVLDFDRQAPRASAKRCARFWTWAMRARASGAGCFRFVERLGNDGEKTGLVGKIADLDAADALENDLNISGRLAFRRDNRDERADVMESSGRGSSASGSR